MTLAVLLVAVVAAWALLTVDGWGREALAPTPARTVPAVHRLAVVLDPAADPRPIVGCVRRWPDLEDPPACAHCGAALARTLNEDRRQLLDIDERRRLVADLRQEGHSLRAIGGALGVSKSQVANDLAEVSTTGHLPNEVHGRDGKTYPARRPEPEPAPLPDGPLFAEGELGAIHETLHEAHGDELTPCCRGPPGARRRPLGSHRRPVACPYPRAPHHPPSTGHRAPTREVASPRPDASRRSSPLRRRIASVRPGRSTAEAWSLIQLK